MIFLQIEQQQDLQNVTSLLLEQSVVGFTTWIPG